MSNVAVIIVLVVVFIAAGLGVVCTWSWWKRQFRQCLNHNNDPPPVPEAIWGGSPTFDQLDPSALGRRHASGDVTIDPLPTLNQLNVDSRESFELRRTFPGIVPQGGESSIFAHDWFHQPFENFPRSNLEYIRVLGKGWFGKVIEAEAKNISPISMVKRVVVNQMRDDANDREQMKFLNQCRVYRDSEHGNILKLLGFAVDSVPYITIFEYWPLGDVKGYLITKEKSGEAAPLVNQGVIARMAIDIGKGLDYLHTSGFIHEDLSARNCLVCNVAGKVIVGDYGLSHNKYPKDYYKISNSTIPIRWSAPESYEFKEGTCNPQTMTIFANIWSYGVLLWELYEFGKTPYSPMTDEQVISKVLVSKSYLMEPPNFPYVQRSTKDRLYKLMLSCWSNIPENRPTIPQILEVLSTH